MCEHTLSHQAPRHLTKNLSQRTLSHRAPRQRNDEPVQARPVTHGATMARRRTRARTPCHTGHCESETTNRRHVVTTKQTNTCKHTLPRRAPRNPSDEPVQTRPVSPGAAKARRPTCPNTPCHTRRAPRQRDDQCVTRSDGETDKRVQAHPVTPGAATNICKHPASHRVPQNRNDEAAQTHPVTPGGRESGTTNT